MITVPAQIFRERRAALTAAARSMPGVCGVLLSSRSLLMTLTPSTRQSRFWESAMAAPRALHCAIRVRLANCEHGLDATPPAYFRKETVIRFRGALSKARR